MGFDFLLWSTVLFSILYVVVASLFDIEEK